MFLNFLFNIQCATSIKNVMVVFIMHYFLFLFSAFFKQPGHRRDTIKIFTYRQPALLAPILEALKSKGLNFR